MNDPIDTRPISYIDSRLHEQNDKAIDEAFRHVATGSGQVDNMYKVMALSPNVIRPIHELYLAIAHDKDCPFAHWEIELLSVQVAILNNCSYALAHHWHKLCIAISTIKKSMIKLINTLKNGDWADVLEDNKLIAMLDLWKKALPST